MIDLLYLISFILLQIKRILQKHAHIAENKDLKHGKDYSSSHRQPQNIAYRFMYIQNKEGKTFLIR